MKLAIREIKEGVEKGNWEVLLDSRCQGVFKT